MKTDAVLNVLKRIWFWFLPIPPLASIPFDTIPPSARLTAILFACALALAIAIAPHIVTVLIAIANVTTNVQRVLLAVWLGLSLGAFTTMVWWLSSTPSSSANIVLQPALTSLAQPATSSSTVTPTMTEALKTPSLAASATELSQCLRTYRSIGCHTLQAGETPYDFFGTKWDAYNNAHPDEETFLLQRPQYIDAMMELNAVKSYGPYLKPGIVLVYKYPPYKTTLGNPTGSGYDRNAQTVINYFDALVHGIRNADEVSKAQALVNGNVSPTTTINIFETIRQGRCAGISGLEGSDLYVGPPTPDSPGVVWALFLVQSRCVYPGRTVEDLSWVFVEVSISESDKARITNFSAIKISDIRGLSR